MHTHDNNPSVRRHLLIGEQRRRQHDTPEHLVATTCIECGTKGQQPGPTAMIHKTILCEKCQCRNLR